MAITEQEGLGSGAADAFIFPASPSQQGLWFLHSYAPESPAYNIPVAFRLVGSLDVVTLESALNELVLRHEALRTTFEDGEHALAQIVAPAFPWDFRTAEVRASSESGGEEEARGLIDAEARRPFDLCRGPLARSLLVHLPPDEYLFLVVMHHSISDGWSVGVFLRELAGLYNRSVEGTGGTLPELPVQYVDYTVWQQEWLSGDSYREQLAYWRTRLAGRPESMGLPADRQRPARLSFRGAEKRLRLGRRFTAELRRSAAEHEVSLFMLLLTCFKALLSRYSGEDDIVVGTAMAGRNREELEGTIGLLVNMLVLRTDLSGDPPFRELLCRVRDTALAAYSHQDLPFEKLVEGLQIDRDPTRPPLFQVAFAMQDFGDRGLPLIGLQAEPLHVHVGASVFDLTLFVRPDDEGLDVTFEYNTNLFEPDRVSRMLGHWQVVLEGAIANPDARLSELPLLTEAERQLTLVTWNATTTDYPRRSTLPEVFAGVVRRDPAATALIHGEQTISYGELDRRSDRMAGALLANGVSEGDRVGVCIERSPELVVAFLGILKTGSAYVPLDPSYPSERLSVMLEDAAVATVVTRDRLADCLSRFQGGVLLIDRESDWSAPAEVSRTERRGDPEGAAYVMFTSGSTGRPKGVVVPHRAILRLLFGVRYARLGPQETILHMAPSSFDASTFELWGALLHGGRCVLVPDDTPGFAALRDCVRKHNVTVAWLTASLFNVVIDEAPEALLGVRQLLTGGEALSVPHVRRALEVLPETTLINGYGPTEGTTFSCCHRIVGPLPPDLRGIPIGRPIANTRVYVLDRHGNPTAVGAPGELYIGGDGLALGYAGRPDLTADRCLPDPFTPGERLYRSGDLVSWRPDGAMDFLGRIDRQVKIRGFRIELEEIEAVLARHSEVRACRIETSAEDGRAFRLVAYVSPSTRPVARDPETGGDSANHGDPKPDNRALAARLTDHLRQTLPPYMVPSAITVLDQLPLTPAGKLDRDRLPPPCRTDGSTHRRGPESQLEELLLATWCELLGTADISVTDGFFDSGGNSLMGLRLFDRIAKDTGVRLPPSVLFEAPTVEKLARVIAQGEAGSERATVLTLCDDGPMPPLYCAPAIGGDVMAYRFLSAALSGERSVRGIRPPRRDQEGFRFSSLVEMAAHLVEAMREADERDYYMLAGHSWSGILAYEMACELQRKSKTVPFLGLLDTSAPAAWANPNQRVRHFFATLPAWLKRLLRERGNRVGRLARIVVRLTRQTPPDDALRGETGPGDVCSLAAHYRALAADYTPETHFDGTVSIFPIRRGPPESATHPLRVAPLAERDLGWSRYAGVHTEVYGVPGDHGSMMEPPAVAEVARAMIQPMARALQECSTQNTRQPPPGHRGD